MSIFRSWMFVPGNQERRIGKVKDLQADVIVFDLEDAVPPAEKEIARTKVREALEHYKDRTLYVRVNELHSPYFLDDVSKIIASGLSGIMLPKAAKPEDIMTAEMKIAGLEQMNRLPSGSIEIMPLVETAQGIHFAYDIAKSSARIRRFAFGALDYTLDIHAELSGEGTELLFARSQLVVQSRAAGIESPIDTVFADIRDPEGLLRDTVTARRLGFEGKLVVHPDQIGIVNDVFAPKPAEIEYAGNLVAVFEEAVKAGKAAIQFDGKMIDFPVAARAQIILEKAKLLGIIR